MQNTISETTTHRTLKQMGYSSRRPHRVLLLSAKNRKRRQQFAQIHQNWTIEDWTNVAWSDESRFLLRYSMNEWCIYIVLYCVLLYTQSTLQSYGVSPPPPPIWNHSDGRVRIWHKEHERKLFFSLEWELHILTVLSHKTKHWAIKAWKKLFIYFKILNTF